METHKLKFSNEAITVHDIIGEDDDKSLEIIQNHLLVMETEITSLTNSNVPNIKYSSRKAKKVKQLKDRISSVSNLL